MGFDGHLACEMKKTAIVYWLLPAKPERGLLREIVRILRKEFRAPDFEPHLTLFVSSKDGQSPKKVLQEIHSRPIRLSIRGVAFSPKFTKTLFVRFKSDPALRKLTIDLGRAAKSSAKAPSDPHVSLVYKKISPRMKQELAAVIKLPFRSAVFDSIAAARLTLPVRTGADVSKWKIVAKKSLRR
jgi:2'-5' RNA ligase